MKLVSSQAQLSRVVIKGYKSIADCDLSLASINVLIGSNGSGKSNLISFFKMIREILEGNLQTFVSRQGGPDALLYFGRKRTPYLNAELYFGDNRYSFSLEPTRDNRLMFRDESFQLKGREKHTFGAGHFETKIHEGIKTGISSDILEAMRRWRVYHFHDTSDTAIVKQARSINDNAYLRSDASNLAAYLYLLRNNYPDHYARIVKTVQLAAPFFGGFHLRPNLENGEVIELEWVEKGADVPFKAYYLSDGTLRFICLATVFLQPEEMQPETILVDEPELGLHPYAIELVAAMMKSVAVNKQLILGTQSVEFLNQFTPEDVLIVDRGEGRSSFKRLEEKKLVEWLSDYTLGELWKKNYIGGRPPR
ncbi:MAG: AAA family ATPase [Chlamydiae bacterium]|nr:AAA family ATPase [Chlamydiota bacterium]